MATFRRELRWSDEVVAVTEVVVAGWIGAEEREEGD